MMRRKLILGNWKMYKTSSQARSDFLRLGELTKQFSSTIDIGVAAASTHLAPMAECAPAHLGLLAQNCHWEKEGAFTGEVSSEMLRDLSVQGSLVAHSERRQFFGESNLSAGKRVRALLDAGLDAVYCVGETLSQREAGELKKVLTKQLLEAFDAAGNGFSSLLIGSDPTRPRFSIAYEPVWAIGTGKAANAIEAQEAHAFVREVLTERFGAQAASRLRILYGGSVKPANIAEFLKCPDVDGALVGGASLKPEEFAELCSKVTKF